MKVAIVGNCQAELVQTLFKIMAPDVTVHSLEGVHNASNAHRDKFLRAYLDSDIIFSQPISNEYRVDFASTQYIRSHYKEKLVLFTNFWLNGYDPSFFPLTGREGSLVFGPLAALHSRSIIRSFVAGQSVDDAVKRWQNLEYLQDDAVRTLTSSLDDIVRRDEENDVKCSEFIIDNYQTAQICFTPNHPLGQFLVYLASKMLTHCGVKHNWINPAALLDAFRYDRINIAPNPFMHTYFHMKFDSPTLYRGRIRGSYDSYYSEVKFYTPTELVESYYEIYQSRPRAYWAA